jgi:hypothetical protein
MLQIRNTSPFAVALVPGLDKTGVDLATVVIKGTFAIDGLARSLSLAAEQRPIIHGDEHHGEPAISSVRFESETSPTKAGTDLILLGHAYSSRRPSSSVDVAFVVGDVRKVVRVFGERRWSRGLLRWRLSDPEPFERIALRYEEAFGGPADPRNPVGTGFHGGRSAADLEGLRAPSLEDPSSLVESIEDRPVPAGFGFIGRSWLPRVTYAGTYDERWREERCPLLPTDFNERYFHGAHPDLVTRRPLQGGEAVSIVNASPAGAIQFEVPRRRFEVCARIRGETERRVPMLDTLLIEPDERRVIATWKATFRCPKRFLYIDHVLVREEASV